MQTLARYGPQTAAEAADHLGKSRSAAWNALERLRERDWVAKDVDSGRYRLTDKGLTVAGILEDYLAEYHTEI